MNFKVLFVVITFFVSTLAFATEVQREFKVEPGKELRINLKTGADVRIEGWDKSVVQVNGSLVSSDPESTDIRIEQTTEGVEVRTSYAGRRNHYNMDGEFDIRVPSRFNISLESSGGSVTIRNVEGVFDGTTMGGSLDLSGLKGKISLSTMGGNITLTKSHLDGEVSTMGGEVLLEEVSGNVQGSTMGGKVIQKNMRGSTSDNGEVKISSMGGELTVQEAPAGADLSTMGGDIRVFSAKDYVKASTMGGDIQIDAIDGWVDAETMGGDVEVKMTGDASKGKRDVELTSMSGDIELTVPQNLSMRLDVELAYTKGNSGRYSIQSDFPIQTDETKEWDYEDGSPRKYISGTGKTGSGEHRIRIRTVNGNVILKKGY